MKFTSNQFVKDIPLPVEFQKHFKPVMDRLISRPAGSVQEHSSPEGRIGKNLILSSMLSLGPVQKCLTWSNIDSLFKCHGPHYRDCLDAVYIPYLKECYNAIYGAVDEEFVTGHCNRYVSCSFSSERYGSRLSRGDRCSFILAKWCALGGKIDRSGQLMDNVFLVFLLLCGGSNPILLGTVWELQWKCGAKIVLNWKEVPHLFQLKGYMASFYQHLTLFRVRMC